MTDLIKYKQHAHSVAIYFAPIVCLGLLFLVLNMTNPVQSGPVNVLVVFVLLYLCIFSTCAAMVRVVGAVVRMVKPGHENQLRTWYYILSVVSVAPILLVALNTLGQLALLEIILIFLLVGLGCFYVVHRTAK